MDMHEKLKEFKEIQSILYKKQSEFAANLQIQIENMLPHYKDIPDCVYHLEKISRHLTIISEANAGIYQSICAIFPILKDHDQNIKD